jgi:hypothetical protein
LILFQEEAKSYANQHWDHQLVERTWTDTMTVRLLHSGDPTHKNRTSEPLATVTLGLNCSWKVLQILANIPDTALWDDSIIIATTDFFEGCEIAGQPRNIVYNCAHCGGDYQRKSCQSCDISYPSIPIRDWLTPLPQKIIQLLESQGHSFASQFASP